VFADGRGVVQTPAADMGMGTATVQIQHAADRLDLSVDQVSFHYGDSKLVDTPVFAAAYNQTASIFAAVQAAVDEIHKELLALAKSRPDSPLVDAKLGSSSRALEASIEKAPKTPARLTVTSFAQRTGLCRSRG
jgi:xanthine dehydrogenase YagR molybdenum-binding subunit